MQFFSVEAIVFSKIFKKKFDPQNMKKPALKKLLISDPQLFLCIGPAAQTAQKQKSCTTKSPLMQDWVFRMGNE